MKCKHQFFETNKIEHKAGLDREQLDPDKIYLSYTDDYGVQTACALCTERRQVWQSGKVNVYNKNKQIWEKLET